MNLIGAMKTMSSLEIAKLTGKEHSKVMADIKRVLDEAEIGDAVFRASYKTPQNKELPCYNLPRRECDLVIAGYSVKYRLAIIDRWQELESQQQPFKIPTTLSEALLLAGQLAADKEALQAEKLTNLPKIEFAEKVRALDGSISIGDFAKVIGTGQNRLFKRMRDDGFLMVNNHPMQSAVDRGLLVQIEQTPYTDSKGKSHPAFQTRITGKGQVYFEKRYRVQLVAVA